MNSVPPLLRISHSDFYGAALMNKDYCVSLFVQVLKGANIQLFYPHVQLEVK